MFFQLRGVSGGEKRRVSIGVDLIHDPSVLFLDEPTSGLDSTAGLSNINYHCYLFLTCDSPVYLALKVVQILYSMAEERNRTIVLTIHQPSYRMLSLIHKVLVLAHGSAIYQGSYCGLADYFEGFGKKVPQHVALLSCKTNFPLLLMFFSVLNCFPGEYVGVYLRSCGRRAKEGKWIN